MIFAHSTQAANLAELRRRFRDARGVEAGKIARWLLANLSDAQLKALFGGLTNAQLTALKTRLGTLRDRVTAVEASAGE